MDLITSMLRFIPHQRSTLADLIGHPWMQGDHASHVEVKEEFKIRHQIVKLKLKAEADKK